MCVYVVYLSIGMSFQGSLIFKWPNIYIHNVWQSWMDWNGERKFKTIHIDIDTSLIFNNLWSQLFSVTCPFLSIFFYSYINSIFFLVPISVSRIIFGFIFRNDIRTDRTIICNNNNHAKRYLWYAHTHMHACNR